MKINSLRLILFTIAIGLCIPQGICAMDYDNHRESKSSSAHDYVRSEFRGTSTAIPTSYWIVGGAITLALIIATRIALSNNSKRTTKMGDASKTVIV